MRQYSLKKDFSFLCLFFRRDTLHFFILIIFFLFFNPLYAAAQGVIKSEIMEGFKKWYASVHSLKADFYQYTFNPIWGQEQEAMGDVCFQKPGIMRWEYKSGDKDIIVVNKEGLFWYTPEDNQVIKRDRDEAFRDISPMSILGEDMQLEQDFDILNTGDILSDMTDKGEKIVQGHFMLLKPKKSQVNVDKIRIEVRAKEFSLAAIEVEEESGTRNRIEFKKIQVNPDFKPDLFIFSQLPGMKVISPKDFPFM